MILSTRVLDPVSAGAQNFADEFSGPPLGSQWLGENVTLAFANGWITLTGPNNSLGRIILQVPQTCGGGIFPLKWPWAFESRLDCPNVDPNSIPFKGGIGVRCYYGDGQQVWLELGRLAGPGKNVVYAIGEAYADNATGNPALEHADQLYLRMEGFGSDQRSIRLGVRANLTDPWTWSLTYTLSQPVVSADYFQILKHDASHGGIFAPKGDTVTFGFDYAHFEGESFDTLTPWTPPPFDSGLAGAVTNMHPLDLETRARLAINAMNYAIQPFCKVPYLIAQLPAPITRTSPVGVLCGEFFDGLAMARLLSGTTNGLSAEELMKQSILRQLIGGFGDSGGGPLIEIAGHKHLLPSLLTMFRLNPSDPGPLQRMSESLKAFSSIALTGSTNGQPYLYYPVASSVASPGDYSYILYHRSEGWQGRTNEPINTGSACFEGVLTLPFAQYYELTHDSAASDYLDKFIRFLLERATDFNRDGSFTKNDVVHGQVWSRMMTIEGILLYGLASQRTDLIGWAWNAFDRALQLHGTSFGWLPENLAFDHGLGCETDTMTAQTEIAFILARRLDDAYWEVAERIAMNQLLAQQLWRVDFLQNDTTLLGAFSSACSPNEWWTPEGPVITQSAHGSGMRALYDVWYHAAWWEQGIEPGEAGRTLRINLHWSKNLPGAQIVDHLFTNSILEPGLTLEVNLQRSCYVVVRKPDWAETNQIQVRVYSGGDPAPALLPFTLSGRWLRLGHLEANTRVRIEFPETITNRQDIIHNPNQGDKVFTTTWHGNAVTEIQPAGSKQPNDQGRTNRAPYLPTYTATHALDPLFMTPLEQTDQLHAEPFDPSQVTLNAVLVGTQLRLSWTHPHFFLQENQQPLNASGWQNVSGGEVSPVFTGVGVSTKLYRLMKFSSPGADTAFHSVQRASDGH